MTRHAHIVIDLGFGDQGKGTVVDALARHHNVHTVIRFGAPQAGHGVITPDGRYHIFAQFGSATFVDGVETFLSKHMVIEPWRMMAEEEALQKLGVTDAFRRTMVSASALVITPFHAAANRLREIARGDARHGSCGL
ncbi:MAG: adenylosuccinate synthetase, partial [Candidatus Diapherotrites archaeon]|nr:adenylosuccinate synthetase [Candidatus Diapherotrites archaeon]